MHPSIVHLARCRLRLRYQGPVGYESTSYCYYDCYLLGEGKL
jgi:hypothetical protein